MPTPSSPENENRITWTLKPSSTGPLTLDKNIKLSEMALQTREQVSMGDAYLPSDSTVGMQKELDDQRARLALITEANPVITDLNAAHDELLHQLYSTPKGTDVTSLQEQCATLARQIVEIESSVDVGA